MDTTRQHEQFHITSHKGCGCIRSAKDDRVARGTAVHLAAKAALQGTQGSTVAEQKKATKAQIALAWLLAQKPWIVPIPGTTKLHLLEENLGGASVKLTPEDLKAIHDAISAIDVQGDRYPAQLQSLINR